MKGFVLIAFLLSASVFGKGFGNLNMGDLSEGLLKERKVLSGRWKSGEKWNGYLCNGAYQYDTGVRGEIKDLKMDLLEETVISIQAEVGDIFADAFGSYKTEKLLCIPFSLGVKATVERVSVRAKATLVEEGTNSKIVVRVLSTHFGPIHFTNSIAPGLESFVTKLVNVAFRWVWDSRIGTWLSQRITDEINKNNH